MTTKEAIAYYGSATKLANALGIWKTAISQWDKYPPLGRQYQLKDMTNGRLQVTMPKGR